MYGGGGFTIDPERFRLMEKGAAFFRALLDVHIPHIAVENPIMHYMAKQAIGPFNGTIQTVQPWQYGTGETKGTQLWLKGLPELVPTNIVSGRTPRVHYASPGPDRWKERSRTDPNIADAMADQWSWYLRNLLP